MVLELKCSRSGVYRGLKSNRSFLYLPLTSFSTLSAHDLSQSSIGISITGVGEEGGVTCILFQDSDALVV